MIRHRKLVAALTVALLGAAAQPVLAQDTAAVAVNTKDGSSIFKLAFHVHRTMSDVVDQSNAAVAYASCEDCRTVAVAIQVVLVMSDPSIVEPENLALAVNESCTSCETLASAYQYVLGTGGPVYFDAEGNQQLTEIHRALIELSMSSESLTIEEIQAEVDLLVDQLYAVIDEHLVVAGAASDADTGVEEGEPEPAVSPGAEVSPAEAATPGPSYSPEETSSAGPEYSAEPSASPETSTPEPEPSSSP
jgi:putative peptide zinc metalloprotease protein